jgi:hypothetical protein
MRKAVAFVFLKTYKILSRACAGHRLRRFFSAIACHGRYKSSEVMQKNDMTLLKYIPGGPLIFASTGIASASCSSGLKATPVRLPGVISPRTDSPLNFIFSLFENNS